MPGIPCEHSLHSKMKKSFLGRKKKRKDAASKLLVEKVWGLDAGQDRVLADAYINHYINLLRVDNLLVTRLHGVDEWNKVVEIIELVKANALLEVTAVISAIKQASLLWSTVP